MSHKIFENDLVVIRKIKFTLTLNKPAYTGMCILELSKVLMYEFHYDYIKMITTQNSYSQKLTVLCIKLKPKMSMKILAAIKKCLILVIISLSQNTMMIQTN